MTIQFKFRTVHRSICRFKNIVENMKSHNHIAFIILFLGFTTCPTTSEASTKIDCHPLSGASKEACESLGCVWLPIEKSNNNNNYDVVKETGLSFDEAQNLPLLPERKLPPRSLVDAAWCFFPDNYEGYQVEAQENGYKLTRKRPSGLPSDLSEVMVDISAHGDGGGSVLRVKIYAKSRFQPVLPLISLGESNPSEENLVHSLRADGHLVIARKATGAVLFDTDLRKLIFSEQFIQLNSKLNSPFVYGLGEHYTSFLKIANETYKTYSFYHTDRLPLPGGTRSYGSFPFYVNLDSPTNEGFKHAHGVYLHNTNAMDIILQADQSITFRPIGGILDFFIFSGPTQNDVVSQYQHLVGLPQLPPRWALGFHLCRYNYNTLEKTQLVWQRTRDAGIPFDVQWNDIDYMERHNDFTYDKDKFKSLPEFVERLHNNNMHYVILFDPGLSLEQSYRPYELGLEKDIFVKNASGKPLVGKVWNDSGRTVFPDFSNLDSIDYWNELFVKFQQEVKFDGAWIDMNDISNFVDGSLDGCPEDSPIENPPYLVGGYKLQTKSLCLSAKHKSGLEYDVHNLYSFYEAILTYKALLASRPKKRPFIISRSSSPGQGYFGGHWSGDVLSTWDYLRWSIPSLIEHSMYGYSLMGSDICGFVGNTTEELCARWSTLGAFYTFSRNHNDDVSIDQDPVALGNVVVEANKNALKKRYSLLPYLYSLIHRAHRFGEPAIRSIPFEFYPIEQEALKVEYQFMWGQAIMVSPVVEQGTKSKSTYLPKGRWYETNVKPNANGNLAKSKFIDSHGEWYNTDNIDLTDILIFYRGGHIVPIYKEARQTTLETVKQPIGLEVSLCEKSRARGELFLDDGDNIDRKFNHFTMTFFSNVLNITQDHSDYDAPVHFGSVKVRGYIYNLTGILANNRPVSFTRDDHEVSFDLGDVSVSKENPLTVELYS